MPKTVKEYRIRYCEQALNNMDRTRHAIGNLDTSFKYRHDDIDLELVNCYELIAQLESKITIIQKIIRGK
jgi:hypothetical protein